MESGSNAFVLLSFAEHPRKRFEFIARKTG